MRQRSRRTSNIPSALLRTSSRLTPNVQHRMWNPGPFDFAPFDKLRVNRAGAPGCCLNRRDPTCNVGLNKIPVTYVSFDYTQDRPGSVANLIPRAVLCLPWATICRPFVAFLESITTSLFELPSSLFYFAKATKKPVTTDKTKYRSRGYLVTGLWWIVAGRYSLAAPRRRWRWRRRGSRLCGCMM